MKSIRVAVVGAGPSGLFFLHRLEHLMKLQDLDGCSFDVKCYEKSSSFGGMWQFDPQVGDNRHSSMYEHMWSNSPKETIEVPSYTFADHFGNKPMGSVVPRAVMLDFLKGVVNKSNLEKYIHYNHAVTQVKWNEATKTFQLWVENNAVAEGPKEFDYVVVGTGHYSVPNYVDEVREKLQGFQGKIEHSHNYRRASDYRGDRLLVIGNSYSAEDLALQLMKFKATKRVTLTYHKAARNYVWPEGVDERPMVTSSSGNTVTFEDGSTEEYDTVIMATGYHSSYPFLDESLQLKPHTHYYTSLYNGAVFTACPQLFYIGSQNLVYSFNMFELQAAYVLELMLGRKSCPSKKEMDADVSCWEEREKPLKSVDEIVAFQTAYVQDLAKQLGDKYPYDIGCPEIFSEWEGYRLKHPLESYRDTTYTSMFTNIKSSKPKTPWFQNHDDSIEGYFKTYA